MNIPYFSLRPNKLTFKLVEFHPRLVELALQSLRLLFSAREVLVRFVNPFVYQRDTVKQPLPISVQPEARQDRYKSAYHGDSRSELPDTCGPRQRVSVAWFLLVAKSLVGIAVRAGRYVNNERLALMSSYLHKP